jgi:hypothetical protein
VNIRKWFPFQKKDGSAYRGPAIQHVEAPESREIDWTLIAQSIFYFVLVCIVTFVILLICLNVSYARAQDYTLANDTVCSLMRVGL